MLGITLSSEQIRQAPPDVRQWIEREVIASLGLQIAPSAEKPQGEHLASCDASEVAAILTQIQNVLPAVNVFFEFGRPGTPVPQAHLVAFRLLDIADHARLPDVKQVIGCINLINEALGKVNGDASGSFCGFDREGHCFITVETQQNIHRLWQTVVGNGAVRPEPTAALAAEADGGTIPPTVVRGPVSAHLGNSLDAAEFAPQP